MSGLVTYCDVILPLALPKPYTYVVPFDLAGFIRQGHRVIVQFGKNRYYAGIVHRIHHEKPVADNLKLIEGPADEHPVVTPQQLQFWEWMSSYYLCTIGEVMSAALPAGLKISSETKIIFNANYEGDYEALNDEEFLIVQALREQRELFLADVQKLLNKRNVYTPLRTLFNMGIAISAEEIVERYRPRTEAYIRLNDAYRNEENLEQLYKELSRAPKQVELLLAFTQLHHHAKYIKKSELLALAKCSPSVLQALVNRNVFQEFRMEVSRLGNLHTAEVDIPPLSEEQQVALQSIREAWQQKNVVLLHGVTGSGKTNVYMELIQEVVSRGEQALYILPEIALTAQIINRLRKAFGNQVGVYHSKFNLNERVEIWHKVLHNEYKIVVSARSGLFLPYQRLGLVIIDEEHDSSLKQADPAPRYHARDAAIVLAGYFHAKVLLGTATPALETRYNVQKEKFGIVQLIKRYGKVQLPEMIVVDMRQENKQSSSVSSISKRLYHEVNEAVKRNEQVILFINRRGFAHYQICQTCNYVNKCRHCDVSLTYHKYNQTLRCHYCGYAEGVAQKCKSCGAPELNIVGAGTQRIEEEIAELFPQARIARMDYDTTKTKHGHAEVIAQFENREIDILVGTQMLSKGLDFDHVSLVGIVHADQLIHFPGFRSHEKAFQLMTQVAGRAGRKNYPGKVIIQTAHPMHPVIQCVLTGDYQKMYENELTARRQFLYPPFVRLIEVQLRNKQLLVLEEAALFLANEMRRLNICKTLGPSTPFVSKINNFYLRDILIKIQPQQKFIEQTKSALLEKIDAIRTSKNWRGTEIRVNVDP
ncbi:MAG: primosomal protein N' [Chitinophagales bacterium]|nr:primosomal protein N' [Chitinophagales bacterium]MDW8418868.1 primosomal protein N' [Chitinophagales bacterium]